MDIRDWASLVGMFTGVSGFTFSFLNYSRERPRVKVEVFWNGYYATESIIDKTYYLLKVEIVNSSRRPIYIKQVNITVPKKYCMNHHYSIGKHSLGAKIEEGSAPVIYSLRQEDLESWLAPIFNKFPKAKTSVAVEAVDSTGRKYFSKSNKLEILFKPSGL
jgi:hypothetical protein